MPDPVDALILDFLAWVAREARPYTEANETWRTSCPRLPVWEEAQDRGLVTRALDPALGPVLRVTEKGAALLRASAPGLTPPPSPSRPAR